MKSTRKLALTAAAAVAACAIIRSFSGSADDQRGEDPGLLIDRVWVDSQPEKLTDYVQAAYVSSRQSIGVFQKASAYDYRFEVFKWKRDSGKVDFTFPQSGKTTGVKFTITKCDDLPPFDLCLDLSENPWGGPKRYHGMREQDDEAAKFGAMRDALRAHAEGK